MSILAAANNVIEQADWRRAYKERRAIESRWRSKPSRTSTLKGHRSTVFCVFPMNDRRLISAGDDASIRIWDLSTKTCEHVTETSHAQGILGMYYCPLTNKVLTGCYNGEVKIWEINIERRAKVSQMTARELKDIMDRRKVYYGDCIEKSDLVSRVLTSHAMPILEQKHVMKEHNANVVGTHMMNGLGATAGHDSRTYPPSIFSLPVALNA
jgi:WD40 repeat protein